MSHSVSVGPSTAGKIKVRGKGMPTIWHGGSVDIPITRLKGVKANHLGWFNASAATPRQNTVSAWIGALNPDTLKLENGAVRFLKRRAGEGKRQHLRRAFRLVAMPNSKLTPIEKGIKTKMLKEVKYRRDNLNKIYEIRQKIYTGGRKASKSLLQKHLPTTLEALDGPEDLVTMVMRPKIPLTTKEMRTGNKMMLGNAASRYSVGQGFRAGLRNIVAPRIPGPKLKGEEMLRVCNKETNICSSIPSRLAQMSGRLGKWINPAHDLPAWGITNPDYKPLGIAGRNAIPRALKSLARNAKGRTALGVGAAVGMAGLGAGAVNLVRNTRKDD